MVQNKCATDQALNARLDAMFDVLHHQFNLDQQFLKVNF